MCVGMSVFRERARAVGSARMAGRSRRRAGFANAACASAVAPPARTVAGAAVGCGAPREPAHAPGQLVSRGRAAERRARRAASRGRVA